MTLHRLREIAAKSILFAFLCAAWTTMAAIPAALQSRVASDEAYGKLPIVFEQNHGQADPQAKFIARGPGYAFFLTQDGAVMSLLRSGATSMQAAKNADRERVLVGMTFLGAKKNAAIAGERSLESQSHYFKGRNGAEERTSSKHFGAVRQIEIYPGIDAVYYGNQQQLEYDFIVAPGANPDAIRLVFRGIEKLSVDESGALVLHTEAGNLLQQAPVIYQSVEGERKLIEGAYSLRGDTVGFTVAAYDKRLPLVIDPVLSYSTFVGGDGATAVAVDASGNSYITGWVSSLGFPLVNAFDSTINITKSGKTDTDAFVSKLNATGTALVYSTYLGGNIGVDRGSAIAIDSAGNAYVTGSTTSNDFPTTAGAYQAATTAGGAFVAKLGPAGNTLVYSTYIVNVQASAIAADANGNAYVGGNAYSSNLFVTTPGAIQGGTQGPGPHAFVIKFNTTGTAAVYSSYFGGGGEDKIKGIAIDVTGNVFVAGSTTSNNFPAINAYQPASAGGMDGFVAKINSAGSAFIYSTYLGGNLGDYATAIAIDDLGSAYVTGATSSFNFPTLNAFQRTKGGASLSTSIENAFVTKLAPAGNALAYSSFLGGESCIGPGSTSCLTVTKPVDIGFAIAVDKQGHAIVAGRTTSVTFPLVNSLQPALPSNGQAPFVSKVSQSGNVLLFSTLMGGNSGALSNVMADGGFYDAGRGIGLDASGNAYVVASISVAGYPTTAGAFKTSGINAAFKLAGSVATVALASSANPINIGQSITLTANVTGATTGTVVFMNGSLTLGSVAVVSGVATLATTLSSVGIYSLSAIYRGSGGETDSAPLYQVINPATICN